MAQGSVPVNSLEQNPPTWARQRQEPMGRACLGLIAIVALLSSCAVPRGQGDSPADVQGEFKHDGLTRTYFVHVPPGYDSTRPMPLVFALHGGRGNGGQASRYSGLSTEADRSGFLVAYPDGFKGFWRDGRAIEEEPAGDDSVDDAGFLIALIDHLAERYAIDQRRIYVTGASNGAFMANRLACEHADRIAAIAPVIGSMSEAVATSCRPSRPMPVLMINGTEDKLVPWQGNEVTFGRRRLGRMLSVPEVVEFWVRHNRCIDAPVTSRLPDHDPDDGTQVVVTRYLGCRDGSAVDLYAVEGGGHTWPRGVQYLPEFLIGRTTQDFDANRVIWEFLEQYRR